MDLGGGSQLREIGGDLERALDEVNVPSYVIDPAGVIRWVNPAGMRIVGDVRGRQFTSVVAAEDSRRSRELFARTLAHPSEALDAELVILSESGERISVDISSIALIEEHRVVGVFGQVSDVNEAPAPPPHPHLTPRQTDVLRLLERGYSTGQIAETLHLSRETVRNHVRGILRALGVHSRLEAVAVGRREHLAD
jgi:PAS domain S-box-containing protein